MYGRKRVYAPQEMYGQSYRPYKRTKYASSKYTAATRSLNRYNTRGPSTSGSLTAQVKSLQRVVKQLQPELKAVDIDLTQTNLSLTGTVVHLSQVAQGDNQGNRTGNLITIRKLDVVVKLTRYTAYTFNDAGNAYFRWALIVDKEQYSDTSPGAGDVFQTPGDPWLDFPNLSALERFRFLYVSPCMDLQKIVCSPSASSSAYAGVPTQSAVGSFSWNGEIKVGYNGTGVSDIEKNGVYLVLLTSGTNAELDMLGKCRICFTDV